MAQKTHEHSRTRAALVRRVQRRLDSATAQANQLMKDPRSSRDEMVRVEHTLAAVLRDADRLGLVRHDHHLEAPV